MSRFKPDWSAVLVFMKLSRKLRQPLSLAFTFYKFRLVSCFSLAKMRGPTNLLVELVASWLTGSVSKDNIFMSLFALLSLEISFYVLTSGLFLLESFSI